MSAGATAPPNGESPKYQGFWSSTASAYCRTSSGVISTSRAP